MLALADTSTLSGAFKIFSPAEPRKAKNSTMKILELAGENGDKDASVVTIRTFVSEFRADEAYASEGKINALLSAVKRLPRSRSDADTKVLWELSYQLWNRCVEVANAGSSHFTEESQAKLKQCACDILVIGGRNPSVPSSLTKIAGLLLKTGLLWYKLKNFTAAENATAKAAEYGASSMAVSRDNELLGICVEIHLLRAKSAWALEKHSEAASILESAATNLLPEVENKDVEVAELFLQFARDSLVEGKEDSPESAALAIKFGERAYSIASSSANRGNKQAAELRVRNLKYLAGAHLEAGRFEDCVRCTSILKVNSTAVPAFVHYVEMKALAALKRHEEAVHELKKMSVASGLTLEMFCAAIRIILQADEAYCIEAAKEAFIQVAPKFSDTRLLLFMLEGLLARSSTKAVLDALEIAKAEENVSTIRKSSGLDNDRQCAFVLLWNAGCKRFCAKDYQLAINLFEASILYIDDTDKKYRAKALRVICLCHMALCQYDRALDSARLAEEFKIALQKQAHDDAMSELVNILKCPDFEADYLTLACHEAMTCGATSIAHKSLYQLLELYKGQECPTAKEAVVFRSLIQLLQKEGKESCLTVMVEARSRVEQVGGDAFFGTGEACQKEAEWFAKTGFNHGLKAGRSQNWGDCTGFLSCAASFCSFLDPSKEVSRILQLSLILAVAAKFAQPCESAESASYLHEEKLLQRFEEAYAQNPTDDRLSSFLFTLKFELSCKKHDRSGQLAIIGKAKNLSGLGPEHLFHMGLRAAQLATSSDVGRTVAISAVKAGLQVALESSDTSASLESNLRIAAASIRKLIVMLDAKQEPTEVLLLYREAIKLFSDFKDKELPKDEITWFSATAWNRAPVLVKFQRYDEASGWMKLALDYSQLLGDVDTNKDMMERAMQEVELLKSSQKPDNQEE